MSWFTRATAIFRHWRQSPDSRGAPQHRSQGDLRQQPDLRDDRRPDRSDYPRPRDYIHFALRDLSSRPSIFRIWSRLRAQSTSRAGRRSMFAACALHYRGLQQKGIQFYRSDFALPHALPAPQQNGRRPRTMKYYKEKSKTKHGAPTGEVGLTLNRRNHRRQVRRPRPSRLQHTAQGSDARVAGRQIRRLRRRTRTMHAVPMAVARRIHATN